jgi:hypothetical protein
MIIKAYFYDTFWSNTPKIMYQLNLQNTAVKITYDDLNNFSICEFSISFDNEINK